MVDYRKILAAYIAHVGRQEGTDFLGEPLATLTNDENAALHEVAAETAAARPLKPTPKISPSS